MSLAYHSPSEMPLFVAKNGGLRQLPQKPEALSPKLFIHDHGRSQ
jgi:hypothetical protein